MEPKYDHQLMAFTQQPRHTSAWVRSEGWHVVLLSAWRDLNLQPPLPKRCPNADRSTSLESGEGEKYPDCIALHSGYSPRKVEVSSCLCCPKGFVSLQQVADYIFPGDFASMMWLILYHVKNDMAVCQQARIQSEFIRKLLYKFRFIAAL